MTHRSAEELRAGLDEVRRAPRSVGTVELIVRRPDEDAREVLEVGELHVEVGLVGDTWDRRPSTRTDDGGPHPDMQLNVMNHRAALLVAVEPERVALCGDQLYLDLDVSEEHLPPGTRLSLGSAVIEVTDQPHRGCAKFSRRFGVDALRLVNSDEGVALRLRGLNARVVTGGSVRQGDKVDVTEE